MECIICKNQFSSKTKRKTCSLLCSRAFGVSTRKTNGSYSQSKEQRDKISKGINEANKNLLSDNKPIEKYRNQIAAQLIYNNFGVLILKECKQCKQLKEVSSFDTVRNCKISKTGLISYCQECNIIKKREKRRNQGIKELWKPNFVCDAEGNLIDKECSQCHMLYPISSFRNQSLGRWGKSGACKRCEASKTYMRKYGIDIHEKERVYKEQKGLCNICQKQKTFDDLFIDHDHTTGREKCFRGLLCQECNLAYGALGDGNENTIKALKGMLLYYCRTKNILFSEILNFLKDV